MYVIFISKYIVNSITYKIFLISKMSVITSSRLINFLYFLDSDTEFSPYLAKYIVTKYAEVEASEEVVKALMI